MTPEQMQTINWKFNGISEEDVVTIMGFNPEKTPLQLWREKVGRVERQIEVMGFMTDIKANMERFVVESPRLSVYKPRLMFCEELPQIKAALMWDEKIRHPMWYRLCGQSTLDKLLKDKGTDEIDIISQYLMFVCQQQAITFLPFKKVSSRLGFACSGMEYVFKADHLKQEKIIYKCVEFWNNVVNNIAPPAMDRDYVKVSGFDAKARQMAQKRAKAQELWDEAETIETEISEAAKKSGHLMVICGGIKFQF